MANYLYTAELTFFERHLQVFQAWWALNFSRKREVKLSYVLANNENSQNDEFSKKRLKKTRKIPKISALGAKGRFLIGCPQPF